jgi:integrase
MKLTQKTVDELALPAGKTELIVFDSEVSGLGVRIRSNSKGWVFQYRLADRQRRMALGQTSAVSLKAARKTAGQLQARVKLGEDPQEERRRTEPVAETIGGVLPGYLARQRQRLRPRSVNEIERHLAKAARSLHKLAFAEVDRRRLSALFEEVTTASGPAACNRMRASLSAYFAWAVREGFIDANIVLSTNAAIEAAGRDRVLAPAELRDIWRASGDCGDYGVIIKILMLTAARRSEIGGLTWGEVDLAASVISLPAPRAKNGRPFILPLSPQAVELLRQRPRGEIEDRVFSPGNWTFSKSRLDKRIDALRTAEDRPAMASWVQHDLRRTASTVMHETLNIQPHIVEATLNHIGHQGGVAGKYNKATYLDEKRAALDAYGSYIASIVGLD